MSVLDSESHRLEFHVADGRDVLCSIFAEALHWNAERPSYRADGRPARWALDLRRPLSTHTRLAQTAEVLARELTKRGIFQIAGVGVAGTLIVSGVVATSPGFRGGVVRGERKAYGFREIVEGSLSKAEPIAFVDDILASGRTMARAMSVLRSEGYETTLAMPVFHFAWRMGRNRIADSGAEVAPLASVHYAHQPQGGPMVTWEAADTPGVVWERSSMKLGG